jgi:hypothetical protein
MITYELKIFGLNDMYKYQIIYIFKINDVIIKMDNYEHRIEHFSVMVDL